MIRFTQTKTHFPSPKKLIGSKKVNLLNKNEKDVKLLFQVRNYSTITAKMSSENKFFLIFRTKVFKGRQSDINDVHYVCNHIMH